MPRLGLAVPMMVMKALSPTCHSPAAYSSARPSARDGTKWPTNEYKRVLSSLLAARYKLQAKLVEGVLFVCVCFNTQIHEPVGIATTLSCFLSSSVSGVC